MEFVLKIVTRPDKGRVVVILKKSDYINGMNTIISNRSNFIEITDSIQQYALKMEDKINNFLRKMKRLLYFNESLYKQLYFSGHGPVILYGLP